MFENGLQLIGDFIVKQLQIVLEEQGHRASGNLIETMRSEVKSTSRGFSITIYGANYSQAVAQGLPPGTKVSTKALAEWVETKVVEDFDTITDRACYPEHFPFVFRPDKQN